MPPSSTTKVENNMSTGRSSWIPAILAFAGLVTVLEVFGFSLNKKATEDVVFDTVGKQIDSSNCDLTIRDSLPIPYQWKDALELFTWKETLTPLSVSPIFSASDTNLSTIKSVNLVIYAQDSGGHPVRHT